MAKRVGQDKAYRAASEIIGRLGNADEAIRAEVAAIGAAARTEAQRNQALLVKIAVLSALALRSQAVAS